MSRMTKMLATAIILSSLTVAGCHKGGSEIKQATPEEAKKNAELEKTAPHMAPTQMGAVERINLSISGAMESYRQHKWGDVGSHLNSARQETEKVLEGLPDNNKATTMRQTFGEMKEALDRTIQAADNRSQEVEGLLTEVQTRVMALKVMISQTQPAQP